MEIKLHNPKQKATIRWILLHVSAWVLFIVLMVFTSRVYNAHYKFDFTLNLINYSQAALIFYGSNFLFFRYLPGNQYRKLAMAELVFIVLTCALLVFCGMILEPLIYGQPVKIPTVKAVQWFLLSTAFWLYVLLSVLSLGYYFARRILVHQGERREAEKKQLLAEQGKIEAEYAFLRAQINPHFLYNTLNFFYAKSLGCAPELSEGILILNDIMRYSLESNEDEQGLVLLRNEIEHVENVIRLHQLRFSGRLKVNFIIHGEINSLRIVPLVLITLVENAFKHGDLSSENHPVSFELSVLQKPGKQIVFSSSNKKKKGPLEAYSGIGLVNIKKRLAAAYGNNCSFETTDQAEHYQATLKINLTNDGKNT
ncbi:MAG: hypothetical protein EOP41_08970 [Sphingobacteriaceae bacterium]|nr:MAG: hypothetical protein EOP41_08970 [Sphingobacteriaceae bacterium]